MLGNPEGTLDIRPWLDAIYEYACRWAINFNKMMLVIKKHFTSIIYLFVESEFEVNFDWGGFEGYDEAVLRSQAMRRKQKTCPIKY